MKTSIDWLTFRCRNSAYEICELISPAFGTAAELLDFAPGLEPKDGWKCALSLLLGGDIVVGRIDYGGDSQRGWVRVILTGEGCAWVQDWDLMQKIGLSLVDADIRRLDVALTTYAGEVNHEMVKAAHGNGEFKGLRGGRDPKMKTIECSAAKEGQTVYIGARTAAKFLRCYDKGLEMIKDCADKDAITHIGGDLVEGIYRVEVEFKAVDDFYLPWAALTERDSFFSGAYPFCASLIDSVEKRVITKMPDFRPVVLMDRALENCRISYGNILRTALEAFGGDRMAVMERVLGTEHSKALVEAGVLTVVHPH